MAAEKTEGEETTEPAGRGGHEHFFFTASGVEVGESFARGSLVHGIETQSSQTIEASNDLQGAIAERAFCIVEHRHWLLKMRGAIPFCFEPGECFFEMVRFQKSGVRRDHDETKERNVHGVFDAEVKHHSSKQNPIA